MGKIAKKLTDLIGHTPLLELSKYSANKSLQTPIIAKVEFFNPGGSVKDRIALSMIEDAEKTGRIKPGATIIEPTSGNTGVGLALVAAVKGYRLILTMPETMSVERRNLVKAYGAKVVLTDGKAGMPGAIKKAEELRDSKYVDCSICVLPNFRSGCFIVSLGICLFYLLYHITTISVKNLTKQRIIKYNKLLTSKRK